jgi:hypothetical protein
MVADHGFKLQINENLPRFNLALNFEEDCLGMAGTKIYPILGSV